jgi:rod shape-determining protein MreD
MAYILLPVVALLVVIFQMTILNVVVLYKINIEMSLALAVYAGLRMDALKGGGLIMLVGYLMDCMVGSATGFFIFLYVSTFFVSMLVSSRIYIDKAFFVGFFTAICASIEGLMIILFYRFIYEIDIYTNLWTAYIPQALLVGILSPLFFKVFGKIGVLLKWQKQSAN